MSERQSIRKIREVLRRKFGGRHTKDGLRFERALVEAEEERKRKAGDLANRPTPTDGAIAAKVFAALDEGLAPVAIVQRLEIEPEVVGRYVASYHALKGVGA
jgi:hypothetical protein